MMPSAAVKRDRIGINGIPIVIAVLVFLLILFCVKDEQLMGESQGLNISASLIAVWATCLGFMITAVSILLALNTNDYIEMLKRTGHYKTILICFVSCCFHIWLALAMVILFTIVQHWSVLVFAFLCASTIDVLLIMVICLYFLLAIVIKTNN